MVVRQDTGVTFEQWIKLISAAWPAAATVAVAVIAGLDWDRRRRFRSYLSTEFDLLGRMREQPAHEAAADQLARSVDRRVLALCAEEEPYSAKERLWRQAAVWFVAAGIFGPGFLAAVFGLPWDTVPGGPTLPLWGRLIAAPLWICAGLVFAWTNYQRGRRRLRIRDAAER
jgi:hypothetical protein